MIRKANMPVTAKSLSKWMDKKTIVFDNAIQRALVWDRARKSLLIHSMMVGYPIPAFYAARQSDGLLDCLDGKQRSNAIYEFLKGNYRLVSVPPVQLEDGTSLDVNGMDFEHLPEELQDAIKDYSLTFYYFDGITEEEINELFFRLNNGKPLTAIEMTRTKASNLEDIQKLASHEIFNEALTLSAMRKYTNEDIAIKTYVLLFTENPSFETKVIRPLTETISITSEQQDAIISIYDYILAAYKLIKLDGSEAAERHNNSKIAKRVLMRTHMLSIAPIALECLNKDVPVRHFAAWCKHFFAGDTLASISNVYNDNAGAGSSKPEAIRKRLEAIESDYESFR